MPISVNASVNDDAANTTTSPVAVGAELAAAEVVAGLEPAPSLHAATVSAHTVKKVSDALPGILGTLVNH
ncbi:MAG: hypothetical protein WCK21_05900 [Actinomycetota bacterium]